MNAHGLPVAAWHACLNEPTLADCLSVAYSNVVESRVGKLLSTVPAIEKWRRFRVVPVIRLVSVIRFVPIIRLVPVIW